MQDVTLGTVEHLAAAPSDAERRHGLADLLETTPLEGSTLRHALIAEQLARRAYNTSDDLETRHALGAFATFTEAAVAYAEDPKRPPPSFPPDAVPSDWWPFDDDGAETLAGLAEMITTMIDGHREQRDRLVQHRDLVVMRLRSASAGGGSP